MRAAQRKESAVHLHYQAEWAEGAVHGAELSATRRVIGGGLSLAPSNYWAQVPFQKQQSEDLDYESLVNNSSPLFESMIIWMVKYTSKYFMCKAKFKKLMLPENMFKATNRQKKKERKKEWVIQGDFKFNCKGQNFVELLRWIALPLIWQSIALCFLF